LSGSHWVYGDPLVNVSLSVSLSSLQIGL
jgi:hypothetical protein